MKKSYTLWFTYTCVIFICFVFIAGDLNAQCNNADFSTGSFAGWTGTYSAGQCTGTIIGGMCDGCSATNPANAVGFNQGPDNNPLSDATTEYSHIICTSGNLDSNIRALGGILQTVYPGNAYSARMGSMWQDVSDGASGDGETMSYSFTVTAANSNFTYYYAVVLNDGGHAAGAQPYFNVAMKDGSGNAILCAGLEVDATTAATIGGFTEYTVGSGQGPVYVKPWTPVFIPLTDYLGQTVTITFTTRGCLPGGCAGSHYAYAYISAGCGPLNLISSSPSICAGRNITLAAPAGAATYSWSGPGIVSGDTSRIVTINQPGQYSVSMATFGNFPCNFSMNIFIPGSPVNLSADFSATNSCPGSPVSFTDLSTPAGQITSWAWNFNGGSIIDATTQNPTYTFDSVGTFPVSLMISTAICTADTIIYVVVDSAPSPAFSATSPLCEGTNSSIVYTGSAPGSATYTWNFDGGSVQSGTGQGPYQVNWNTGGNKNITLTVAEGSCNSLVTSVPVLVNPLPALVVPPDTAVCIGESITLNASGATTYSWSPTGSLNNSNTATVISTPDTTTIYTVTGSNTDCTATTTIIVAVTPIPTATFTGITPVCAFANSTLTYTGNAGINAAYSWGFADGTATPGGTLSGPQQVNWPTPGIKTVTLTVAENGCISSTDTITVAVDSSPTSFFTAASPVCAGQSTTITYIGSGNNLATYSWNFDGGTVIPGTGQGPQQITWPTGGTENITLVVSENGCSSPITTLQVAVSPVPTAFFTVSSPVDTGQNCIITYTGNASVNAAYFWNFAGGNIISGTGAGPYSVKWETGGTDTVTLYVTDNGCISDIDTQMVIVNVRILAINEITNQLAVNLYPNPVAGREITLTANIPQAANVCIRLYDVLGRLLNYEMHQFKAGINSLQLNYNNLNSGNYYMQVLENTTGKSSVLKFVIQ